MRRWSSDYSCLLQSHICDQVSISIRELQSESRLIDQEVENGLWARIRAFTTKYVKKNTKDPLLLSLESAVDKEQLRRSNLWHTTEPTNGAYSDERQESKLSAREKLLIGYFGK